MKILPFCFLGFILGFSCVCCSAQDSRMDTADEYPFLAADLAAGKREIWVKLSPPADAENPNAPRVVPQETRVMLEKYFTQALSSWLEAARRAQRKKRNRERFAGVHIPDVKVRFFRADCTDADVNYSFALTDLNAFLGETVTRAGGFAGQINGRLWLVVGYPKELYQCQAAVGDFSACRAWNNRRAVSQAEGGDLLGEVGRMLRFVLEHEMGHVLGLSHYSGVMSESIHADDRPARPCVKDGERLLALMSYYLSRQNARLGAAFVKSSLESAFFVPVPGLR